MPVVLRRGFFKSCTAVAARKREVMENASKRLPVVPAFVLAACLLCILSVWPLAGPALAASVYFADPLGNTEISRSSSTWST